MTIERIATLVTIFKIEDTRKDGKNQTDQKFTSHRRYQNALPETQIELNGKKYDFLNFIYSGATLSLTGDNVSAQLTLSSNDIARSKVAELVNQNYRADVYVCRMNGDFKKIVKVLSKEQWMISSAAYDATAITMELSSGLDAANANTPRRVLITSDVGPLPVTGRIRL